MAMTIIFLIFPHCEKVLDLQVMLLGADKQGGQPGGCEGQGGVGHALLYVPLYISSSVLYHHILHIISL